MPSSFDLHALPVEIRLLIFRECLAWAWHGSMPALIVALRGDSQLYHEALEVFYAKNRLIVFPWTEERIASMSRTALRTVQNTTVYYGLSLRGAHSWNLDFSPHHLLHPLWNFTNLRSLMLTSEYGYVDHWLNWLEFFIRRCVVQFPRLQHLALEIPKFASASDRSRNPQLERIPSILVQRINLATGVQGVGPGRNVGAVECWTWETENDQTLVWTDEKYARSVPWSSIGIVYQHLTNYHRHVFWRTYGTTFAGLMCRRMFIGCYESCSCTKIPPPLFKCNLPHDQGFTCGVAPHGLDSYGRYSMHRARL